MLLIPVIDLLGGEVVRAVAGQRERYGPQPSVLCKSSSPVAVVEAFVALYPFETLYIADLDAIAGGGDHRSVVQTLLGAFPQVTFWLDAGFHSSASLSRWMSHERLIPVLGSESQANLAAYETLVRASRTQPVLSLDFNAEGRMGPAELYEQPHVWTDDVIVMTLDRVGVGKGPAFEQLRNVAQMAPGKRIFAAGGLRSKEDAQQLEETGCSGVLVASALLDGKLVASDVASLHADS